MTVHTRFGRRALTAGLLTVVLFQGALAAARDDATSPTPTTPEEAAAGVLRRVIPARADRFVLATIPRRAGRDVFEVEAADGRVQVRGSSGVAIASGVNWYLQNICHCDVSWCGDQLKVPDPLPALPEKVVRTTPFAYRYFFNYCAFSYTMAWWDWPRWQRLIDWMALHGINMPLAVTGQESVWLEVCRKLGLSDAEINRFLVGPAYLPFGWMGCIDGWGGPLPRSWIVAHRDLQRKILARERALGMTPVLQGFTGHVPAALKAKHPEARFRQLPSWAGFPGTLFLDPLDPLFRQVGKAFVEEQTRQFGTNHLYAADTFIEMSPPSSDPAFLSAMGRSVLGAMCDADPDAVWVMQGWLFVNNPGFWKPPQGRALLTSVPDDRLLVLDLMCESDPAWKKTKAFFGKPWIFCIIQTFGDTVSLHGGLPQIAANLEQALSDKNAGRLRGIGHIFEGLGCNPVVHDFLADMTWQSKVPDVSGWLHAYVERRYGRKCTKADLAWTILGRNVYSSPGPTRTLICQRPALALASPALQPGVARAWRLLLDAASELNDVDTYRFDLVNVTRQSLGGLAGPIHADIVAAYRRGDRKALAEAGQRMLDLIDDLDELLATRRELLLGRWLSDARRWATTDAERAFYEWNARNQITLWGPPDSMLHEYAEKQWAGMMRGFYGPRWRLFVRELDAALAAGKRLDAAKLQSALRAWENRWAHTTIDAKTASSETSRFAIEPTGDAVAISRRLLARYGPRFREPDHR
ncbi:MAG: alpha-N-acetylglucosaminidase [Isosphaeraceae bacterium]